MPNKKVLIITYYWPPSGGVGVQRWMNFALQLKDKGWEPIIITPENPQFEIKDEKLFSKVADLRTYKVPIWEPFDLFHKLTGNKERKNIQQGLVMEKSSKTLKDKLAIWIRGNLLVPDPRVFWVKRAARFASNLIKEEQITTMITTGPPHSIHLVGRRIKRKTHIKWVADFRDPWSKWDVLKKLNTSNVVLSLHQKLERSVLNEADVVTTVSSRLAQSFGNAKVLTNGVSVKRDISMDPDPAYYTIGYFGMLNEMRNPSNLWKVLDQLCREDEVFASKLRIRIAGIVAESIKEEIGNLEMLNGKVEFLGYLPHDEIQQEYQRCDLLLLLLNQTDNSEWILPVKFFEYLATRRLILCLGPRQSDLGDLMNDKDIGEILSYEAIDEIRSFIIGSLDGSISPSESDMKELLDRFFTSPPGERIRGNIKHAK